MTDDQTAETAPPKELTRAQRRVLGVLVEKAFTTPEYYPLTLKAVTTGCNQKNNRDPVVNYDEDRVEQVLEELQDQKLVAIVHTDTGRSARYRHYMRHRFTMSEPQLAILTELLLRGRQSLGELRTRASRMVPIDSLDVLRTELNGLLAMGLIQTQGLDRRGAEVDHALYTPQEQQVLDSLQSQAAAAPATDDDTPVVVSKPPQDLQALLDRVATLEATTAALQATQTASEQSLQEITREFAMLREAFEDLRRQLGG